MTNTPVNEKDDLNFFSKKVWLTAGIVAFVVIFLLLFKALFSMILLTLAGIILAVFFHGFANLLVKIKVPRKISVFVSVIFNLALLVAFFWFVSTRLSEQISTLTRTIPKTVETAQQKLNSSPIGSKVVSYLQKSGSAGKTGAFIKRFFSSGFGIVSDLYIIILIGLFFTSSPIVYKKGMVNLMPTQKSKEKCNELLEELNSVLKKWLTGQIIGIVFIAVLTGVGLWILGMPLVFTLALIAGLLNFIPNFGPIIALIPAILIAFTQSTTQALIIAAMYTGIQIIQSAVQQPLVQKKMVNIPPVLTIVGQVAMGTLGGFWGVLLATPIVAIIMTTVDKLYLKKSMD